MKLLVTPTLVVLTLLGCASHQPVQTTFNPAYPERNAAGDPIVAVFQGRIPCADNNCDKRKVTLVLYGHDAGRVPTTYWLAQILVGLTNDPLVQQGLWSARRGVQGYADGLVYELDSSADPTLQHVWRVNDDVLLVLDQNLRPKVGNAAWGFMLSRNCAPYGPQTYPYDEATKRFIPVQESKCEPGVSPRLQDRRSSLSLVLARQSQY